MMRRHDFVEKTLYLIREQLEKHLPQEATLDEMIEKAKELIKKVL